MHFCQMREKWMGKSKQSETGMRKVRAGWKWMENLCTDERLEMKYIMHEPSSWNLRATWR